METPGPEQNTQQMPQVSDTRSKVTKTALDTFRLKNRLVVLITIVYPLQEWKRQSLLKFSSPVWPIPGASSKRLSSPCLSISFLPFLPGMQWEVLWGEEKPVYWCSDWPAGCELLVDSSGSEGQFPDGFLRKWRAVSWWIPPEVKGSLLLNYSGSEGQFTDGFLRKWRAVSCWILSEAPPHGWWFPLGSSPS